MVQKSLIFVSLLIWQCQTGKPALPFKLNEGPKCAMAKYHGENIKFFTLTSACLCVNVCFSH